MSSGSALDKVKKLREITGVGFKDCKSAIDETKGDIEKSVELLRKKGIAKASKRMGKTAAEGLVCIYENKNKSLGLYVIKNNNKGERSFFYWRSDSAAKTLFENINLKILFSKV